MLSTASGKGLNRFGGSTVRSFSDCCDFSGGGARRGCIVESEGVADMLILGFVRDSD